MDKRIDPRFSPIVLKAQLEVLGESFEAYLINLSRSGGFISIDEPPVPETEFLLRALLPFKLGAFEAEARVVWRSEADNEEETGAEDNEVTGPRGIEGFGFRLTSVSAPCTQRLLAYLAQFESLASRIDELPALHDT